MTSRSTDSILQGLKKTLDKIALFHGHYCPGIAYGLRVSLAGIKLMAASDNFELNVISGTTNCPLDAVQMITGCTVGNGKLFLDDRDRQEFTFWNHSQDKGIVIKPKKVFYRESIAEAEAMERFAEGDKSRETLRLVNARLQNKIESILLAEEKDAVEIEDINYKPDILKG